MLWDFFLSRLPRRIVSIFPKVPDTVSQMRSLFTTQHKACKRSWDGVRVGEQLAGHGSCVGVILAPVHHRGKPGLLSRVAVRFLFIYLLQHKRRMTDSLGDPV